MIHIQLDPSVITVRDTFEISLSLAGVYMEKDGNEGKLLPKKEGLPAVWMKDDGNPLDDYTKIDSLLTEDLKKTLYPWKWTNPNKIRVWFIKETDSVSVLDSMDLNISSLISSHYTKDDDTEIQKMYEKELDSRIFKNDTISYREILQEISNEKNDMEFNKYYDDSEKIPLSYFLSTSIAGKAQKLAPFNELLKLVFFSNADLDLTDCKAFVAFPIDDKNGDWTLKDTPNTKDIIINQYEKYKKDISRLTTVELTYKRTDASGAEYEVLVGSAVTPIPEPDQTKHGIVLRDDKANFEGTLTTLDVKDTEDWSEKWLEKLFYHINPLEEIVRFIRRYARQHTIINNDIIKNVNNLSRLFFRAVLLELRNHIAFGEIWEEKGGKSVLIDTVFHKSIREALKTQLDYDHEKLKEIALKLVDYQPDWKKLSPYLITSFKEDEKIKERITFFYKIIEGSITDENFNTENFLSKWKEEISLIHDTIKINGRKEQWVLSCITESAKNTDFKITDSQVNSINVKLYKMFTHKESWNILEELCTDIPVYGNYFVSADELRLKAFKKKYLKFISPHIIEIQEKKGSAEYLESCKFQWRLILKCFFHVADENLTLDTEELKLSVPQLRALGKRCFAVINLMSEEKKNFDKVTYSNIPPIRIRLNNSVEKMDLKIYQDPRNIKALPDREDDLFDEIGGYIAIQNRSKNINDKSSFENEWKYLNRCRVNAVALKRDTNERKVLKEVQHQFTIPFLIPSFLPKFSIDDENKENPDFSFRQRYVEIKNEKNSLVAGFQKTNNDFKFDNQIIEDENLMLENIFDIEPDSTTGQMIKHVPYAYFYGYNYKFKAYVVLNSGVLPLELRNGSLTSFNKKLQTVKNENVIDFHFLRKVPVSAPRISSYSNTIKDNKNIGVPVPALPEGLKLLTYELGPYQKIREEFYGIKDQTDKANQQELPVTLLHDHSGKIFLTVKKPSTHFWNWYAWTALQSDDEVLKEAIKREYNHNRLIGIKENLSYQHFCDPAVSDYVLIETKILFSLKDSREKKVNKIVVPLGTGDDLSDLSRILEITLKGETEAIEIANTERTTENMNMELRPGEVLHIKVSGLIDSKYFKDGDPDRRFPEFMKENLVLYSGKDGIEYYQSPPSHYFIETASKFKIESEEIWNHIVFEENADLTKDKVQAYLEIQNNIVLCKQLCLTHQVTTEHQMWNWNGKLSTFNKRILDNSAGSQNVLDPINTDTTEAMKFEVDFAERPDFTSNVTRQFFLTANPDGSTRQIIFTHNRPDEKRALYYLLNVQLHNRYELLEGYSEIKKAHSSSKVTDGGTRWRRHFRKTRISKKLPRPTIRFIIPLTKSLQTDEKVGNASNVASLLIVLDDVWYTEAGLAEKLQVGVEVVQKDKNGDLIMQAGLDPIISGKGTPAFNMDHQDVKDRIKETLEQDPLDETQFIKTKRFVFDAVGPIGLTFDQNSILPKINASCFIVNIPETSEVFKEEEGQDFYLKPWSMMKISVRRALTDGLHETLPDGELDQLGSGWTESEWVQHLPDTKTFIPRSWRDDNKDVLDFTIQYSLDQNGNLRKPCGIDIADEEYLMGIEQEIGENCEKFLILSKRSFDVGGLPTESYVATVALKGMKKAVFNHFVDDVPTVFNENENGIKGYARILTVRTNSSQNNKLGGYKESVNVWEGLFGASAKADVALDGIQSDAIYALPLISERVTINLTVQKK